MSGPTERTSSGDSAWGDGVRWDREYLELRGIPSSHRLEPSRAFKRLRSFLPTARNATVLDAGAGTGRHALFLAERGALVTAVDASGAACDALRQRLAARSGLDGSVRVEQAVVGPGNLPDDSYDVIIDSYVSCHLLTDEDRLAYLQKLLTRLRPGGRLYTACMGRDDRYYRNHVLVQRPGPVVARDPLNKISKLLQPRRSFGSILRGLAPVVATTTESFDDDVAGGQYQRQVLAAVLRSP